MTTDFRALCVELTDCLEKADWPHRYKVVFQQWTDIAHAALAESDGPAVSDDREPASVATQPNEPEAEGPTDMALWTMYDEMCGEPGEWAWVRDYARAALARFGGQR